MSLFYKKVLSTLWVTLGVTLFICGDAAGAEKITYRLKWLINMSTVGDLLAEHQGFFKKQGLAVTIKPGGPERDAIRELELGYADFGVASADQVIKALSKGAPVVVIAQLFQSNPLQWIYFKDKTKLNQLVDLKGKSIGVTFGKNDEFILRTLLHRAGIDDREVRLHGVRLDYTPFFRHQVALWPVYINTQGVEIGSKLRAAGEQIAFLDPKSYGVQFVANSVVTSKRLMAQKPDTVKRFLEALLQGWRTAGEPAHARTAVALVQQYDREAKREILHEQLIQTNLLTLPAVGQGIGFIDVPAWQQTEQIMLANGQIDQPVNIARYLVAP